MQKAGIVTGCLLLVVIINFVVAFLITLLVRFLWGYFSPHTEPSFWMTFWIVVAGSLLLTWAGNLFRGSSK